MRSARHVARMGERRGAYRVLVGRPERKKPLGRPRRRWKDNIKMSLQEVGCWGMDWIELARDWERWRALENAVMKLRVPLYSYCCLCTCILIFRPSILKVAYILLLLSMYPYCCLCILIVRPCILKVVYIFLLFSMYSYCPSMYS
jgi:hypothetical protein